MLTLFNDIPPYDMHSVVECDKGKDTAVFETAVTIQDNHKIARYRVWLSAWKGLENRQRSGAKSKTYMMDVVAPPRTGRLIKSTIRYSRTLLESVG